MKIRKSLLRRLKTWGMRFRWNEPSLALSSTNCTTICIASVRSICPSREGGFREKEAWANDGRGQSRRLSNERNERRNRTRRVCRTSSQTRTTRTGRPSIRSTCWVAQGLLYNSKYLGTLHKNTIILVMLSTNDPCFCNITQHKTQGFGRGVKYMQLWSALICL